MPTIFQSPVLLDKILGSNPKIRRVVHRTLLGSMVYLAVNVTRLVAWLWGMIPTNALVLLFAFDLIGTTTFFVLQRSGWSLRFKDPAMTLGQIIFALSALTLSYGFLEISRGVSLQIICLILVFGMYYLSPKQIFFSGLLAVSMLIAMLLALSRLHSQHVEFSQHILNLALAAVTLPIMSYVARQVSLLRRKQIKQGKDLTAALQRLEELAMRDSLTGLVNRRCVLDMLSAELKHSQHTGQRFCLAMLDVDFFKKVNDTYGHQVGDAVLIGLAQDALLALRKTDVIARWGGEEFLVLLSGTTIKYANSPLSRLSETFATHDWAGALHADHQITVSIGLAECEPTEALEMLISRADQALYRAKTNGRNRIVVAESYVAEPNNEMRI